MNDIKWQHPALMGNPYMMSFLWGIAITKILVEGNMEKVASMYKLNYTSTK